MDLSLVYLWSFSRPQLDRPQSSTRTVALVDQTKPLGLDNPPRSLFTQGLSILVYQALPVSCIFRAVCCMFWPALFFEHLLLPFFFFLFLTPEIPSGDWVSESSQILTSGRRFLHRLFFLPASEDGSLMRRLTALILFQS